MAKTVKKEFSFEKDLYAAVDKFIEMDGGKNFSKEYVDAMLKYRQAFNEQFCGRRYKLTLHESEPRKRIWKKSEDCDVNFGQIWESVAVKYCKCNRELFRPWPKGTMEFPDFTDGGIVGDFKAILSDCYLETKSNNEKGLTGYLKPGGHAGLYSLPEYKRDIEIYKSTGILPDHLRAMLVFAVYEYKWEENTGTKYAIVQDVMVLPALFTINFMVSGAPLRRNDTVTIGFLDRNYQNIMEGNFGV